jgi:hypothetical protein
MSDLEEFKINIGSMSNEKLCDIVIAFRYLGTLKEEAVLCMSELVNRRNNGDQFPYETYIEDNLKTLPKIKIDVGALIKRMKIL